MRAAEWLTFPRLSALAQALSLMLLQDKQLADSAHWCREYAKINAVALRKILEQHDKMLHNSSGQHLLQVFPYVTETIGADAAILLPSTVSATTH